MYIITSSVLPAIKYYIKFKILAIYLLAGISYSQSLLIRSSLPIRDGVALDPDNGRPLSGSVVDYYDNGRIMVKGRFSGGYASGYWSYFYMNGQLKSRGRYFRAEDQKLSGMIENGKVGKWTYWYENGSRKMIGTYKDNKKSGNWIFWHQNSFKHSEGRYMQDEFQGKWEFWYANGNIQETH